MQFQVAYPRDCIGLLKDPAGNDLSPVISNTMQLELTDLSLFNKYYVLKPSITAEDRAFLDRPKMFDIYVQDKRTTNGSNFVQQIVMSNDFIRYIVMFI